MVFRLRLITAIFVARAVMWLVRLLGRGKGSSLPGMVALKICPGILAHLARQACRGVVMVTGTNGKTTTNNMVARIAGEAGYRVVVNAEGANMITGITTAFLRKASLWGRVDCDYALLEVDEATFPRVTRQVRPDLVVVTNFFRDQLDRYGELDTTVSLIRETLEKLPGTGLVLNADDPLVASLAAAAGGEVLYYGLGEHRRVTSSSSAAREGRFCPRCGQELAYAYYQYSQLGNYRCPGCGFSRPPAGVEGTEVLPEERRTTCRLRSPAGDYELVIPVPGLYNLYNGLAAFTAGLALGVEPRVITRALAGYTPATGRMERFRYREKPVLLNLVKNPTGFNEGLGTLLSLTGPVDVLIAINDNDADGRDISWLWDVDFEVLEEEHRHVNLLVCTGQRGAEMAVRLKYAGVPLEKIVVEEMSRAVERVLNGPGKTACFLATYTALWPVERILSGYARRENRVESLPSVS
ncbi:Mur ligase family protein [Desulfofundulus thermocisternus]|uniref:Mur ligase family protein n=1 Tax=Desulfofundulus thermocisternus TaxID=42471 RepID=UPI00217E135F|nr:Mur ligase family protein [Desulfofundulus thermocisternus]MCS5694527.1 Mur ligase family protein [Desulfofundulus thermocisternus]